MLSSSLDACTSVHFVQKPVNGVYSGLPRSSLGRSLFGTRGLLAQQQRHCSGSALCTVARWHKQMQRLPQLAVGEQRLASLLQIQLLFGSDLFELDGTNRYFWAYG